MFVFFLEEIRIQEDMCVQYNLSIGAGGERIPKVVLPPPAPRTPTVFF